MPDLNCEWGSDMSFTPGGDISLVDGDVYARQRIERRLFTAIDAYFFHLDYGAGLLQKIGSPGVLLALTALVRSQIALEASVSPTPAPIVQVTEPQFQLFEIQISYTSADSKQQINLTITP